MPEAEHARIIGYTIVTRHDRQTRDLPRRGDAARDLESTAGNETARAAAYGRDILRRRSPGRSFDGRAAPISRRPAH